MSTPVGERVDDWNERPFSGGYRELQDLAESEFSGVVRAAGAELYMTKGTVVGILRGSMEDFEDTSGTTHVAPTDALPLLAIMQEHSDEVRAKYYSEDTSISEVDQTLKDGNFTGYVELSENVLSGDYYLVYHQGHSMSVAYVGNAEQLLTDEEAFQRANDEVGIYEVRPVSIEAVEIPEPSEPDPEPEPEESNPVAGAAIEDDPATTESESASEPGPAETTDSVTESEAEEFAETESSPVVEKPDTAAEYEPAADTESEAAEPAGAADDDRVSEDVGTTAVDSDAEVDARATEPDAGESTPGVDRSRAEDGAEQQSARQDPGLADGSDARRTEPAGQDEVDPPERETTVERNGQAEPAATDTPQRTDSRSQNREVRSTTLDETADQSSEQTDTQPSPEQTASTRSEPTRDGTEPTTPSEPQQDVPPAPTPEKTSAGEQSARTDDDETAISDDPSSLETRAIPSLDPKRTSTRSHSDGPRRDAPGRTENAQPGDSGAGAQSTEQRGRSATRPEQPSDHQNRTNDEPEQPANAQPESRETEQQPSSAPETEATGRKEDAQNTVEDVTEADGAVGERIEELQALLTEREKEITRLEADLETAETERESVRRELEQVRAERDELASQVEKLESELQRLEEELGAATNAQQRMTPQEALSGTDIFVRYRSKGDATLEKAHDGGAVKQDVAENLRLEKHTQFDADVSAVGGREYDEFLEDTVAYKFVRWVVEDLLFEIQSTGHTETLSDLYDALPKINRVELNGAVNITYTEDGQEAQATETFDVVFRERMGDPLLVANINDSRQGASETMMEGLITAAERVGETSDEFASAFLVTESFFEPEALETVAEATRGGILSRDKRKSFVNLSRKRGYHLCLVEARNQNFHLEVPEL